MDKKQLPSERIAQKEKDKQELEDKKNAEAERLQGAIARIASTDDGIIFLRWLSKECGYGRPFVAAHPATGEINEKATLYQAFRVNLWWKIRGFLNVRQIIEVEHD